MATVYIWTSLTALCIAYLRFSTLLLSSGVYELRCCRIQLSDPHECVVKVIES